MKDDRIIPFIMKMAFSKNTVERIYAIEAFYYLSDERMIFILLNALKDPNKSIRYYAMTTLDLLSRMEAIPIYIKIIQSDVNDEVREKALNILKKIRPSNAFYPVIRMLHNRNAAIRKASLKTALAYKNKAAAYHISLQLMKEVNLELKLEQIKALLKLKSSGGTRGLSSILNQQENLEILSWAIYVAGELKDYLSFYKIIKLVNHPEMDIQIEAVSAIGKYKNFRSTPSLIKILENEDEKYQVQIAALHSLKKINHLKTIFKLRRISNIHKNLYLKAQIKSLFFREEKNETSR